MQKETAMRLCKLAGEKIQDYVKVSQTITYYNSMNEKNYKASQEFEISYFVDGECTQYITNNWTDAESFLKKLTLEGAYDV